MTDLEIMSNKALLTTLKKETEAGEIIWDLEVKYIVSGIKEREIFTKFNQALESGEIKTKVNICWKDKKGKRLNSYSSEVSSRMYEEAMDSFKPIGSFKVDINAVAKASEKLISQVRERNPKKGKYAEKFLQEWQEVTFKNPPLTRLEVEQSVKFVYENELFKQGLVKKAVNYSEYILPSEVEEFVRELASFLFF